jgi:hypothetical protein
MTRRGQSAGIVKKHLKLAIKAADIVYTGRETSQYQTVRELTSRRIVFFYAHKASLLVI